MSWRSVAHVLSHLALILGLCLLFPFTVSLLYLDQTWECCGPREMIAFAAPLVLVLVVGLAGRRKTRHAPPLGRREGFAVVTFSWLLMVTVGMLPYLNSGSMGSFTDAFFETMSGFTTTGATVLPRVEVLTPGVQFWRCMTQWLGGMGIVVLSVALLRFLGVGGYHLMKAEAPGGVTFERERPRITESATELWRLYLALSALAVLLYRLSGLDWYDACCHAFTTMSTGGFSSHTESAAFFGPATQWAMIAFMLVVGANFSVHAQILRLRFGPALRNPELRLYLSLFAAAIVLALGLVPSEHGLERHAREVVFQVISIGTTTGYATADFDRWPQLARLILVCLMVVGGCMGSTGGGLKVARLLIYGKALGRELHRLVLPRAVRPIRVGERVIEPAIVSNILAFGAVFAGLFLLGTAVMAACGYDLETSGSASIAALSNIGPGLGQVGPMANWSHLPDLAKWVMSLLMMLGRLEIFSVVVLLTPWAWKR
jgi:trk system potassium uptake protein TrkH